MLRSLLVRLTIVCSAFCSAPLPAAVFQLNELATPDIGVAGAGAGAVARDAATAYFNPAGMCLLPQQELLLGGQLLQNYAYFVPSTDTPIAGSGDRAGSTTPSGGVYWATPIEGFVCPTRVGIAFNSPYISRYDYQQDWAGRFLSQDSKLYTLALNPSVAVRISRCLSIGAGLTFQYGILKQRLAVNSSVFPSTVSVDDTEGRAVLSFDDSDWGYNLGLLYEVNRDTRIGFTYRSEIHHNFSGSIDWFPPEVSPRRDDLIKVDTFFRLPRSYNLSFAHQCTCNLLLLADIGLTQWHHFKTKLVTTDDTGVVYLHRDWHDTWEGSLGFEWRCLSGLVLQAGAGFSESPGSKEHRTADFPEDRKWKVAAGLLWDYNSCTRVGLAGEYINRGKAKIDDQFLKGHYSDHDGFALTINLRIML